MIFSFHCNISLVSNRISFCVFFEIEISHNQSMIIFHPTLPSNVVNCQCFYANLQNNIERGGGRGQAKDFPVNVLGCAGIKTISQAKKRHLLR